VTLYPKTTTMKKITFLFLLGLILGGTAKTLAQDIAPCFQQQYTDSIGGVFSNAYRIDDAYDIRSANDFLVSQNTASFALDSITADFFYHEATSLDSVSVYFYEDDNDLPGQMIEAYTSVNIVSS